MVDQSDVQVSQPKPIETSSPVEEDHSPEKLNNYVTLYIHINKESLDFINKNGFRAKDNQMGTKGPELEQIFSQTGKDMGFRVDRTKCIFAYPRKPDEVRLSLFNPGKQVLFEVQVDPKDCIVADGAFVTEAGADITGLEGIKGARSWAKSYWETAKPLSQYLSEHHTGEEQDLDDFEFPEVLIPTDIPVDRIKMVEDYKYVSWNEKHYD